MTSVGYGPLWRIDGPLPIPPLYGLLPAAEAPAAGVRIVVDLASGESVDVNTVRGNGQTMDDAIAELRAQGTISGPAGQERWLNGVEVYPYPPDQAGLFDTCAAGGATAGTKTFGEDVAHPQFGAFTAYVAETCASFRIWDQQQFRSRAVTALAAVESAAVARQLMFGEAISAGPFLADGNGDFPNLDAATSPLNALALLENAIAQTGKLGLIHCSPAFASALRERFAIDERGGVIRTINGNVVIADTGYAQGNSTPVTHAPATGTQEWIYATGPVDVRRTEIFVLPETVEQALDRGTAGSATLGRPNRITYRAERYYLVDFDTELQAAVRTDRCQSGCSEG